eukprot:2890279-Rhodomonas_salina.1
MSIPLGGADMRYAATRVGGIHPRYHADTPQDHAEPDRYSRNSRLILSACGLRGAGGGVCGAA